MTEVASVTHDCHAHVYETVVAVGQPRYLPERPAPLSAWRGQLEEHGLKGGVIVQPSFLGTDNTQMLAALAQLPAERFAGVAVVPLSISHQEVGELSARGIRGLRWNLVEGTQLPDLDAPEVRDFLDRSAAAGLHLELHLEGPRLAGFLPQLARLSPRLVIDHLGLPADPDLVREPVFRAIAEAENLCQIWIKISAPYRSRASVDHVRALARLLGPERLVWGSDWPWTRHEAGRDFGSLLATPVNAGLDPGRLNAAVRELYGLT